MLFCEPQIPTPETPSAFQPSTIFSALRNWSQADADGIAALYSIIHIPRGDMVRALREMWRVLRPGGLVLLSFHIGDDTIHLDEWWGPEGVRGLLFFPVSRDSRLSGVSGFRD